MKVVGHRIAVTVADTFPVFDGKGGDAARRFYSDPLGIGYLQ